MKTEPEQIVAVLHDEKEKSEWTQERLARYTKALKELHREDQERT